MANSKALWALILGIIGLIIPLVGIAAIILGAAALSEIKRSGENGKGLSIAGIVLGVVSLLWLTFVFLGGLAYFATFTPELHLPDRCITDPGMSCMDFMVDEEADVVRLQFMNAMGMDMEEVVLTTTGTCSDEQDLGTLAPGERVEVTIPCAIAPDETVDLDFSFAYRQEERAFPLTLSGELFATAP